MQGAIHLAAIRLATLCLGLATGCRTTVDVYLDEREDFSRYRSWDFVARSVPRVDAPQHDDAPALDARVARSIERELLARGFERRAQDPDFLVSYHLALRRRDVVALEQPAPYLLSSMTSSASYWIEGGYRKVLQVHEEVRLAIRISGAESRNYAWRGLLLRTLVNPTGLPLDDAVATLLDRLPRIETPDERAAAAR